MERLRTQAGSLARSIGLGARHDIRRIRTDLDELRRLLEEVSGELAAAREESRGSVVDLTERVGSLNERVERLGG